MWPVCSRGPHFDIASSSDRFISPLNITSRNMNSHYYSMFASLCAFFDQRLDQSKEVLKAQLRQESDAKVEQMYCQIRGETLTMLRMWFDQQAAVLQFAHFSGRFEAPFPLEPVPKENAHSSLSVSSIPTPSPSGCSNDDEQLISSQDEASVGSSSSVQLEVDTGKEECETSRLPLKKRKIQEVEGEEDAEKIDVVNIDQKEEENVDLAKYGYHNRRNNTVILKLECHQKGCKMQFESKSGLLEHMLTVHRVEQYRCQVNQCDHSFKLQYELTNHLQNAHGDMTKWLCSACDKSYTKYDQLVHHIYFVHHGGLFKCATADCTYTDSCRKGIAQHYEKHHRLYHCGYPKCDRKFKYTGHLSIHICSHLAIKPYCCKWPNCDYKSENRSHVISHIRTKHFKQSAKKQIKDKIDDKRNPKQYLQIREDLIKMTSAYQTSHKVDFDSDLTL